MSQDQACASWASRAGAGPSEALLATRFMPSLQLTGNHKKAHKSPLGRGLRGISQDAACPCISQGNHLI